MNLVMENYLVIMLYAAKKGQCSKFDFRLSFIGHFYIYIPIHIFLIC